MDDSAKNNLMEAKRLIISVKNELNSIADEACRAANNVGEENCARALRDLASKYEYASNEIGRIL